MNIIIALLEITALNFIVGGFLFFHFFLKKDKRAGFIFKSDWPYFSFLIVVCIFLLGLIFNRLSSVIGMNPFIWHKLKTAGLFSSFLILPVTGTRLRTGGIRLYYGWIHIILTIVISYFTFFSDLILKNSALVFENGLIVLDLNTVGLVLYLLCFVLLTYEYISCLVYYGRKYSDFAKKRIKSGITITLIYFIMVIGLLAQSRIIYFHGYLYDLTSAGFIFLAFYFLFSFFREKIIRKENTFTVLP